MVYTFLALGSSKKSLTKLFAKASNTEMALTSFRNKFHYRYSFFNMTWKLIVNLVESNRQTVSFQLSFIIRYSFFISHAVWSSGVSCRNSFIVATPKFMKKKMLVAVILLFFFQNYIIQKLYPEKSQNIKLFIYQRFSPSGFSNQAKHKLTVLW